MRLRPNYGNVVGRLLSIGVLVSFVLGTFGLMGCSSDFWDRSPRVAGAVQPYPYAAHPCPQDPCQPARGAAVPRESTPYLASPPSSLPAPQVRQGPPATVAQAPQAAPSYRSDPCPSPAARPLSTAEQESAVFASVNRIRQARGLRPFRHHPALHRAAREHSAEQQQHGYMGHSSPDPRRRTLVQRIHLAGYQGQVYGEVVAWGYRDVNSLVEGWMNSPAHRAILIDPQLTEGAFSRVGSYWTGNFGAPVGGAPRVARQPAQTPAPRRASSPASSAGLPAPYVRSFQPSPIPAARTPDPFRAPRPATPAPRPRDTGG